MWAHSEKLVDFGRFGCLSRLWQVEESACSPWFGILETISLELRPVWSSSDDRNTDICSFCKGEEYWSNSYCSAQSPCGKVQQNQSGSSRGASLRMRFGECAAAVGNFPPFSQECRVSYTGTGCPERIWDLHL